MKKITAFILSILLSTTALAENQTGQYSDVSTMEIREQIEDALADGRISPVEIDDLAELVEEKFDLGEITEKQRNSLFSSIEQLRAAHYEELDQNKISEYIGKACLECERKTEDSLLSSTMLIGGALGLVAAVPIAASGALEILLLFPVVGLFAGLIAGGAFLALGLNKNVCLKICTLVELPQYNSLGRM